MILLNAHYAWRIRLCAEALAYACALPTVTGVSIAATPTSQDATPVSMSPVPPAAKASIYVSWPGNSHEKHGYALFFVNDALLAAMRPGDYANIEVPEGKVVITVSEEKYTNTKREKDPDNEERTRKRLLFERREFHDYSRRLPQPALRWPECEQGTGKKGLICTWDNTAHSPDNAGRGGCAKLNWQRLDEASSEDLTLCSYELSIAQHALGYWMDPGAKARKFSQAVLLGTIPGPIGDEIGSTEMGAAMSMPGKETIPWLQMCSPNNLPDPTSQEAQEMRVEVKEQLKRGDNSNNWSRCSNESKQALGRLLFKDATRTETEAEAGRTYYYEYSASLKKGPFVVEASDFKMKPVDAEAGANDIKRLQLATDR